MIHGDVATPGAVGAKRHHRPARYWRFSVDDVVIAISRHQTRVKPARRLTVGAIYVFPSIAATVARVANERGLIASIKQEELLSYRHHGALDARSEAESTEFGREERLEPSEPDAQDPTAEWGGASGDAGENDGRD